MNLLAIAWKSLRQRALASSLTALSIALGIMLMVAVLVINSLVEDAFTQKGTGFGLVVGGKGNGDLNLVLSAVYRIGMPGEPLPYRYYEELKNHDYVETAVPMSMGDLTEEGQFPIVATIPEYFSMGYAPGKKFTLKKGGRLLGKYYSSVIGSRVAKENGWDVGSKFKLIHGGMDDHVHDEMFEVVGVLGRTGTANDKTVFVDMEAFCMLAGHEKPPEEAIDRLRKFGYEVTREQEETIKIYDKGVKINPKEGVYDLLAEYRMGDMLSPNIQHVEALKLVVSYFAECIKSSKKPHNDAVAGLNVVKLLEASDRSLKNQGAKIRLD